MTYTKKGFIINKNFYYFDFILVLKYNINR